jgi:hypothetical protein
MRQFIIGGALALTIAAANAGQVLTVDSWWSADYAKQICKQAKDHADSNRTAINQFRCDAIVSCPEVMPRYAACALEHDPSARSPFPRPPQRVLTDIVRE